MSGVRLVLLAGLLASLPANPCEKPKPIEVPVDPPPPPPPPSATRPPTWQSVNPDPVVPTATGKEKPEPPSDLTRAKTAYDAKEYKKVKAILEGKVKGNRGSSDEISVLADACRELKDKACLTMLKKAQPAAGG